MGEYWASTSAVLPVLQLPSFLSPPSLLLLLRLLDFIGECLRHNPKKGKPITAASMSNRVHVTGSKNRVVYSPPPNTNYPRGKWGIMKFIVSDGLEESEVGMVWLVPPHQRMVYSDFSLDVDGWYVTNNGAREAAKPHGGLIHEPYGRGLLNHYVVATDAEIHINRATGDDDTRWYFNAPGGFHGNHVVAYGGYLEFSLGSSAGDFSKLNGNPMFVELECATCERHSGIRLAVFGDSSTYKLDGQDRRYRIPLVESAWKKDPKNTLLSWNAPSKCDMVEVLSGITSLRILGDHTVWYESIALDDVAFVHGKSEYPIPRHNSDCYGSCMCSSPLSL